MGVQADHVARPSPLPLSLAPLARPQEKDSFGFSPEGKKKYAETYAGNAPQDPEQDGTDDEEEENTVRSVPLSLRAPLPLDDSHADAQPPSPSLSLSRPQPTKKTKGKKGAAAEEDDE